MAKKPSGGKRAKKAAGARKSGAAEAAPKRASVKQKVAEGAERAEVAPEAVVSQVDRIEADRRALRATAAREVKARMDAYFEAMRPAPGTALEGAVFGGLKIVAQGDSWFDYPLLANGGVVPRVAARLRRDLAGGTILNLAHHGDEVRQMLGVTRRKALITSLKKAKFDAILFSGGGNDVVGDQFTLWLKDRKEAAGPGDALRGAVFASVLNLVAAGYEDLFAIRDEFAPGATVFLHGYCVPFPQNSGVCGMGPWLWPSLEFRGWHDPAEQREVGRVMLGAFAELVKGIAAGKQDAVYVDTQAISLPREEWANEIHPDADGFNKVAGAFEAAVRGKFGI